MGRIEDLKALGEELSKARRAKGLTLEDLESETKIKKGYLSALESGDERAVPAPAYFRGYAKAYCKIVGLDWDDIRQRHSGAFKEREGNEREAEPRDPSRPRQAGRRRRKPGGRRVLIAILAILLAGVFAAVYLARIGREPEAPEPARPNEEEVQSQPEQEEAQPPSETGSPGEGDSEPQPEPPPVQVEVERETTDTIAYAVEAESLQVRLSLDESGDKCWLRVDVDGSKAFEGTLEGGQERVFDARESISLRIGRPWMARLEANGRDLGVAGPQGGARTVVIRRKEPARGEIT